LPLNFPSPCKIKTTTKGDEYPVKVAMVEMDIAWESKEANLARAREFVKKASEEKCDIVVFPEMFASGFSMNVTAIAEEEHGETSTLFSGLAREYGLNLIAGLAIKKAGEARARNCALAYDRSGRLLANYSKQYPFTFAGEDRHYAAGTDSVLFSVDGMPSSVFICYDLRFPEAFRSVARDVHAIFVIANWPSSRIDHWETLLRARAVENQCFVIGVNRTGSDGNGITYPGASHVYDPLGKDIPSVRIQEELLTAEFDPREVIRIREQFPFLSDMRMG
jgi:predicted amidohydrolase